MKIQTQSLYEVVTMALYIATDKYDTLNVLQPWWLNYDQALDLQAPAQQVQYCLTLSLKLSRFEILILRILMQQNTIKPPPPQHKVIKHEQVDQAR